MTQAERVSQRYTARRVAKRFVQATVPFVTIKGKKYVLSDQWAMIGDITEALGGGKPGGPTVHMSPPRFSWFWAYDPERRIVAMWRWSDGDEKLSGSAGQYMRDLHKLQAKGQLNRVTTEEMRMLERYMADKVDQTIKELKQISEEAASEFERKVAKMIRGFFKKEIEPKIMAQWAMIENGWRPDGFKVNERLLEFKDEEKQAKTWAASEIMRIDFALEKIDRYIASEFEGLDFQDFDVQMTYFIRSDVTDEFWEEHKRSY